MGHGSSIDWSGKIAGVSESELKDLFASMDDKSVKRLRDAVLSSGEPVLSTDVRLRVHMMGGGDPITVGGTLEDTIQEIKERLAKVTDIPPRHQQLLLNDCPLKRKATLRACSIEGDEVVLTLVRKSRVPRVDELKALLKGCEESVSDDAVMSRKLQTLFRGHALNEPILSDEGVFDEECSGFYGEDPTDAAAPASGEPAVDDEDEDKAPDENWQAMRPALWHVMADGLTCDLEALSNHLCPKTLLRAAKWMLSNGSSVDSTSVQHALDNQSVWILCELLAAGADRPILADVIKAFPEDDALFQWQNLNRERLQQKIDFLGWAQEEVKQSSEKDRMEAFSVIGNGMTGFGMWRLAKFVDLKNSPVDPRVDSSRLAGISNDITDAQLEQVAALATALEESIQPQEDGKRSMWAKDAEYWSKYQELRNLIEIVEDIEEF